MIPRRLAVLLVLALVAAVAVAASHGPRLRSGGERPVVQPSSPLAQVGRGLYASAVTAADGRINIAATISLLREVGADRYYYLVWDRTYLNAGNTRAARLQGSEWEQLPEFAAAAGEAGISVVVYLVPPTESDERNYRPYGWDYPAWAAAVGRMAREHRNIEGLAIDDFAANTSIRKAVPGKLYLTREVVAETRTRLRAEVPRLKLYALLYGQDFYGHTSVLGGYRDLVDGIIYAFAGEHQVLHAPQNTTSSGGVVATTEIVSRLTRCRDRGACWQAWFPDPGKLPKEREMASAQYVSPRKRGEVEVSAWVADDRDDRRQDTYELVAHVGASSQPMIAREVRDGWTRYAATVALSPDDAPVTLYVVRPAATRMVTVAVADVTIGGVAPLAPGRTNAHGRASSTIVEPLELVLMAYASRFGREGASAGAADATYLSEVLTQVRVLIAKGAVDGVVIYRLNSTGERPIPQVGDPANHALVRSLFTWLRERTNASVSMG